MGPNIYIMLYRENNGKIRQKLKNAPNDPKFELIRAVAISDLRADLQLPSSNRSTFRAWTDTQTDTQTPLITL